MCGHGTKEKDRVRVSPIDTSSINHPSKKGTSGPVKQHRKNQTRNRSPEPTASTKHTLTPGVYCVSISKKSVDIVMGDSNLPKHAHVPALLPL